MAYGTVKVDNITFDNGGSDQNVTVSGLYNSLTSGITVTGTISGAVVIGSTSVSGATVAGVTVTGTTVQGASGTFTSLTGTTIQGTTAAYTTGTFTSLTGTTTTGTTANFVSGVFTTSVSGATVIAPTGTFTSLTGTTTTGTTANFVSGVFTTSVSGATVIAPTGTFTSLTGTTTTGTTANFTSGTFQVLNANTHNVSGNLTVTGTLGVSGVATFATGVNVSGTLSGVTITGSTAQFTTGTFVSLTGTTTQGTTSTYTTGSFTSLTGTTTTGITATYATGSFTSLTGTTTQGTTSTYTTGTFTSLTGTTTTGTTATFASGIFTTLSGTTATFTSGIIASGTAALPSLAILGDPNTGIYSPGADQLAVATNGTGRLFIASDGKIGVGTASPGSALHVSGSGEIAATVGSVYPLTLWTSTAAVEPAIYTKSGSALRFGTTTDGIAAAGFTERFRITSAGLVGIGTSAPLAKLQVATGTNDYTATANTLAVVGPDGTGLYIGTHYDGSGAGTDLVARGYSSTMGDFRFISANGSYASPATRMVIDGSGRVGIGTTVPATKLVVSKGGAEGIEFDPGADTNSNVIYHYNRTGTTWATNETQAAAHVFKITSNEAARIDTSGRLLVGTSSDRGGVASGASHTAIFEKSNTEYAQVILATNQNNTNGAYLTLIKSRGTIANSQAIVSSGDEIGAIAFEGSDGTTSLAAARITAFVDGTPGVGDMPGRLVFSVTADAAASPTERMRITNGGSSQFFCASDTDPINAATAAAAGTSRWLYLGYYGATTVNTGTQSFGVYTNGNVINTNNSYGAISDVKLKENIVDATSQWSDIKALQVRKYNFKEGQTHTQIGLVAQETELVSPGLVSESPDRDAEGNDLGTVTKSVNYSVLYMKAVKALQEAMDRIETLEARLTAAGIE